MSVLKVSRVAVYRAAYIDMARRTHLAGDLVEERRLLRRIVSIRLEVDLHDKFALNSPDLDNRSHCTPGAGKGLEP